MKTIIEILNFIVGETLKLNNLYIFDETLKINYSAIFCQSDSEYEKFNQEALRLGAIVEDTPTGPLYKFHKSVETLAGPLWLLKIRKPVSTHPERGDADFTLKDYNLFKEKFLKDVEHFRLINREHFEMIELRDERFPVLSYFSNIPLIIQLGIE